MTGSGKRTSWDFSSRFDGKKGVLMPAFVKIRALTRGQESMDEEESAETVKLLSDLSVSIPDLIDLMEGVSLWQVEVLIQDSLRKLVSGAVYTFVSMVESRSHTTRVALNETTRQMIHDSKLRARRDLTRIMQTILVPKIRQMCSAVPAIQDALSTSVLASIGEDSTMGSLDPANGIIDNEWLLQSLIMSTVASYSGSIMDPVAGPMLERLDKLPGKFRIA